MKTSKFGQVVIVPTDDDIQKSPFEWEAKISIHPMWVADGFELTAEVLHEMLMLRLGYCFSHEVQAEITSEPSLAAIKTEQGYNVGMYQIINDDGVDKNLLGDSRSWVGQIVQGCSSSTQTGYDSVTIEKPFGLLGTYTGDASNFRRVTLSDVRKSENDCESHADHSPHPLNDMDF